MAVTEITADGATIGTLADYIEYIEGRYRDSDIYGANFRTGAGSVSGMHSRLKAELISDLAALLAEAIAMGNPNTSVGTFLSEVIQFNGITRNTEQYSSVLVSFTAEASGTTVTATSTQVSDGAGAAFVPLSTRVIAPSATEDVQCVATVPGAVAADAGTLTTVDRRPYGLAGVTNATDATQGRLVESDPSVKSRRGQASTTVGDNSVAGIERAIRDLDPVTDAATSMTQSKYLRTVVEGGTDAAIAEVLHKKVAGGTMYEGTTLVNHIDEYGQADPIRFYRVVEKPIYITFVLEKLRGYNEAGGDALVKQRTEDLFAGELEVEGESVPRPRIGDNVVGSKISIGADSVDRCYVRAVRLDFAANPTSEDDLSIEFYQRASTSTLLISIVEAA